MTDIQRPELVCGDLQPERGCAIESIAARRTAKRNPTREEAADPDPWMAHCSSARRSLAFIVMIDNKLSADNTVPRFGAM
jgi:hypothetical protein